jgi:putative tricarboxylic transport membrane protein
MTEGSDNQETARGVISNRAVNIGVALALMAVATVVMVSSYRLGAGWAPYIGPDSGYFPFYVALIMFISSGVTLLQHLFQHRADRGGSFVGRHELIRMLQVLIPTAIFTVLTIYIGIYISTVLFIGFFMMWMGKYPLYKTVPVALAIPVLLFIVFEIWFLIPLPKGPFEAWLGY